MWEPSRRHARLSWRTTTGAWDGENENCIETILGSGLAIALCSLLDIPSESEHEDVVHVFPLFDSELNTEYTLMIGTTYLELPLPEAVAELEEMVVSVAPGVHLMWYLDIYKCQLWYRLL